MTPEDRLVFSDSIYGYYAHQVAQDLKLKAGESKTLAMQVQFKVSDVEGRTVVYFTMKESV